MQQNTLFENFKIIGSNTNKYLDRFKNILNINSSILITGETGTGKELVARWIHFNDYKRNKKPFVKIAIPNIGENIFESEVFGYEKGAFTGAITSKKGLIEVAEDGTIFLDEIENASPSIQSKLLQLLEDRLYRKVGDTKYKKTNARFVIATNKDLLTEVQANNFRSDLFYRLAVIEIKLPPLRERGFDIIEIANHYIDKYSNETNIQVNQLHDSAYKALSSYSWPGNIRELKNFIERSVIFTESKNLDLSTLQKDTLIQSDSSIMFNYKDYIRNKEYELIFNALKRCNWNVEQTAKLIDMSIPFVYKKIKELHIRI
ncbi:MAG: sigma-54-dependent Fis family transcriptional regulator [Clostridiaceae bacterium]|jgi:transcriptional regulator with PAS, ATPase and Fis domain|nr:sigma-54-dependent Fis family transcriptional regulator [Clostridiaceae bacterium]